MAENTEKRGNESYIPEAIEDLISFFGEHLSEVSFPDTSHAHLSALKGDLDEAKLRLDGARAALDEATSSYQQNRNELLASAKRGHAYARVFASDRPELLAELEHIELSPKTTRPKRPRKTKQRKEAEVKAAALPFAIVS